MYVWWCQQALQINVTRQHIRQYMNVFKHLLVKHVAEITQKTLLHDCTVAVHAVQQSGIMTAYQLQCKL